MVQPHAGIAGKARWTLDANHRRGRLALVGPIDREGDLGTALPDARRLAGGILDRYRELDDDDLLIFLSGGKGAHIGLPTSL